MALRNSLVTRNVTIDGRRTSIRLEEECWAALEDICTRERMSVHDICTLIDRARRRASRTSAVRAFIVAYLRDSLRNGTEAPLQQPDIMARLLTDFSD